jgi:DNA-directed RNA polymerase subunit M/transcription elongation factor TFIIS
VSMYAIIVEIREISVRKVKILLIYKIIELKTIVHKTRVVYKKEPIEKSKEEEDNVDTLATIEETCPKCGNPEMAFYTQQLRSVDEGSTIFYTCPKCNYKFTQNN